MTPLLLALALASPAPPEDLAAAAMSRGKPFWQALVARCEVPAPETAYGLVREAVALLGSPDSEWRDDVGYGVLVSCAYRKRLLQPAERRELVAALEANLRPGPVDHGDAAVLRRSFSALDLSVLAALELQDPALDAAGYRQLLDAGFVYLRDERDLRGLEPRVGWIHATAHTADLLKFLARDARFTPPDQARLFDAVWAKLSAPGTPVFTHAEDERLAAALVSVVRRADFEPALLDPWLERFTALEKKVWESAPPEPPALDASQNARNLLKSLYVLLSLPEPEPTEAQAAARDRVLAALKQIRR